MKGVGTNWVCFIVSIIALATISLPPPSEAGTTIWIGSSGMKVTSCPPAAYKELQTTVKQIIAMAQKLLITC
jgi:hypothetical protein